MAAKDGQHCRRGMVSTVLLQSTGDDKQNLENSIMVTIDNVPCWRGPFKALINLASSLRDRPAEVKPVTIKTIEATMKRVSDASGKWEDEGCTLVRKLQDAARNSGSVELMKKGGQFVAVKRMPSSWVCQSPEEFSKTYPTSGEKPWLDLGIIQHLNDIEFPYACKLHGLFRSESETPETFVTMSFCAEGDLFSWVERRSTPAPGPAREEALLPLATQLISGVRYLHEMGIAHRDISLENVLLDDGHKGKQALYIIDFGMATLQRYVKREIRGKASYQAPEMHGPDEVDTFLLDNFAIGVLLFAAASQDYPWTNTRRNSCQLFEYAFTFGIRRFLEKRKLRKGNGEYLIQVFSAGFTELLEALTRVRHEQRASLGETCFTSKVAKRRTNVWDLGWLKKGPGMTWQRV